MVRERSPSKVSVPSAQLDKQSEISHPPAPPQTSSQTNRPQFGAPSLPAPVPHSFSTRPQAGAPSWPQTSQQQRSPPPPSSEDLLFQPITNSSFHHEGPTAPAQKIYRPQDKSGNLFIKPRKPAQPNPNPLLQARNIMDSQLRIQRNSSNPIQPKPSQNPPSKPSSNIFSDVVPIRAPVSQPSFPSRPAATPMYYSQPFPKSGIGGFIDAATQEIGMYTNTDLFNEGFNMADPNMYMDAGRANDDLKALLEGAIEDEEDKPRTRRQKEKAQSGLTWKLEKMKLASSAQKDESSGKDIEEEEEAEDDDGTREGLKIKLLPHQIDGVSWMHDKETGKKTTAAKTSSYPKGGILADDMGLGKTIQAIALMLANPFPNASNDPDGKRKKKERLPDNIDKGTLVVAPLALIKQWEGEIRHRVEPTHTLNVCVHHGPQRAKSFKALRKYDVVITTYHTLVSELGDSSQSQGQGCFGLNWYRVILDEAHSIKNRNAKAAKAACALNAQYRWCLTGTPMQNNLDELQSLIHFLRIKPYNDLAEWRNMITRPMKQGRGGLAIRRLQIYLTAFMKRRTKDVLKQDGLTRKGEGQFDDNGEEKKGFRIVKKTVIAIEAVFSDDELQFYKRLESRADKSLERMMSGSKMTYASALVLLLRLRQACNHPGLIQDEVFKDGGALSDPTGQPSSQSKTGDDDVDSMAALLGDMTVQSKKCDICQVELPPRLAATGTSRCTDCDSVLHFETSESKPTKANQSGKAREEPNAEKVEKGSRWRPRRNVIVDSDDDLSEPDVDCPFRSTKIRRLLEILRNDSHSHKYIVFSFFTSMLNLIEPFLEKESIRYTRYDGAMKNDAREASLEKLRTHKQTRVLLCSLRAGSLGLNLTAASRVVILEPFWNPFVEEQAIDRVHRLNQTEDVVVYKMTIKNSVEERILNLQERKRELANATLEGKMAASKLTLQDMLNLFKHENESEHPVDQIGLGLEGSQDRSASPESQPEFETETYRSGDRIKQHSIKSQQDARAKSGYSNAYDRRW